MKKARLKAHSGLICIDVDKNEHVYDGLPRILCIAGCRHVFNTALVESYMNSVIDGFPLSDIIVVTGGAHGIDECGKEWAYKRGIHHIEMNAQWGLYGAAAGPIRNEAMAGIVTEVYAFWNGKSRGTKNMIECALKYKLETHIVLL